MAQKILLRRGPVGNVASAATSQGELLLVTGSVGNLSGPFITMTGTAGTGTSTLVGKIYEGAAAPSITSYPSLTGTPFYSTDDQALYRLNHAGNQKLDLSGNLEGTTVSAMTVTTLTGTKINVSGDITGSNLQLSGNANIDGNIVLGGNITIGDQATDNISLGGEFTSNLVPDVDATYSVGTASKRWILHGVDSSITGSFTGSFAGDGSGLTGLVTELNITDGTNSDAVDLLTDTLTFTTASNHGFSFTVSNNTLTLGTPQDLKTTASPTFAGATAGNIKVGVTGDNEIDTTSGNLTLDSFGGTVTVDDNLTVTGATITLSAAPAGTDNTVLVLNASNQVVTDEIDGRVWGTSLIDGGAGLTTGRVSYASDSNTITDNANFTFNSGTDTLTVGTSTFSTNTRIAGTLSASADIYAPSIGTGVDNSVVVLTAAGTLKTDEIDARVWGSTLLDGGGTLTATRVPFVSDANTLTDDAGLTYTAATDTLNVGSSTFGTNVTVAGNLTVQGTTTTVDSTTVNIGDNIIVLNAAGTVADGGVQVIDTTGTAGTGSILWNATNDYWYAGVSGSTHYRLATFNSATPATNNVQKVDANKRLVDSNILDSGTLITLGSDVRVSGTTELQDALSLTGTLNGDSTDTPSLLFKDATDRVGLRDATDSAAEAATFVAFNATGDLVTTSIVDGGTF